MRIEQSLAFGAVAAHRRILVGDGGSGDIPDFIVVIPSADAVSVGEVALITDFTILVIADFVAVFHPHVELGGAHLLAGIKKLDVFAVDFPLVIGALRTHIAVRVKGLLLPYLHAMVIFCSGPRSSVIIIGIPHAIFKSLVEFHLRIDSLK